MGRVYAATAAVLAHLVRQADSRLVMLLVALVHGVVPRHVLVGGVHVVVVPERVPLPVEVVPVLDVVDLRDELFLDRVTGMQAVELAPHHMLQVVVRLLDLADVDRLEIYHLGEPIVDNLRLVRGQSAELIEEISLPQDLGVCQHGVDEVHPAGGRRPEDLTRERRTKVQLDPGGEL